MNSEPIYTNTWFSPVDFEPFTSRFSGQPVRGLEVGSYEGQSSNWLVENWCAHPDSSLTCIDTFLGSEEHSEEQRRNLHDRFLSNIHRNSHKVNVIKRESMHALSSLVESGKTFHFAYIDGDHHNFSVITDAIMTDRLLLPGGLIVFDDYLWRLEKPVYDRPREAIEYFLSVAAERYKLEFINYKVIATKNL